MREFPNESVKFYYNLGKADGRNEAIEECKQILKACHMIRTTEDDFASKVEVPFYRKLWKKFDELKGNKE